MSLAAGSDYSDFLIEKLRLYFRLRADGLPVAALLNGSCYLRADGEDRWLLLFLTEFHFGRGCQIQSALEVALSHILARPVRLRVERKATATA